MIYKTNYKKRPAVAVDCDKFKAVFLPYDGAKLASLCTLEGKELLEQAKGEEYLRLGLNSDYISCECSAFDDMFPTVDPCEINGRKYLDHGEVCRRTHLMTLGESKVSFLCKADEVGAFFKKTAYSKNGALIIDYEIENTLNEPLPYIWAGHIMFAGRAGACAFDNFPKSAETVTMFGNPPKNRYIGELEAFSVSGESYKYYYTSSNAPLSCGVFYPDTDEKVVVSFDGDAVKYLGVWINNGSFKGMHNIALEPCTAPFDSPIRAQNAGKCSYIAPKSTVKFTFKFEYIK